MTDEHDRRTERRGMLVSKLRPTTARRADVPARLEEIVRPRFGCLTLLHAGAGYGKTTALAAGHRPDWTWYNLDATDRDPVVFAERLSEALEVEPPGAESGTLGEVLALELAHRLQGRAATVTLDRCEQLGDAIEAGRFLSELLLAAPALALRVATRVRPSLPLERLRLEGRLVEVGPAELRLNRAELADLLLERWDRPASEAELDFADTVLAGWPAAVHLWLAELADQSDLMGPVQPGQPLHEYLHEEVFGTLPEEILEQVTRDWRWLLGRGPLVKRASTAGRRQVVDRFVRDRVAVVPGRQGWRLHPLVAAFASMHTARGSVATATQTVREERLPPAAPEAVAGMSARLVVRTLGGLSVTAGDHHISDASWPAAARRLLELFLSAPGCRTTAQDAAQALWPNHQARAARNSFNVALHGLRRVLEPDLTDGARSRYVVREGRLYRLCVERFTCDAEDFVRLARQVPGPLDETGARRLQAAADLQTGDFLAGCEEDFALRRRAQLRTMLVATLEELGRWYAASGSRELAMPALQRLVALEPGRREAWERLLELHESEDDDDSRLASTG